MADNKSLAHPDWPYAGSAHEWRGFVKDGKSPVMNAAEKAADVVAAWSASKQEYANRVVYQKQNFGPDLK